MTQYAKAFAAVAAAVISVIVASLTDGTITPVEWVNVAIGGVGAAQVFAAPNIPGAKYTKAIIAVLTGSLMIVVNVIDGGITLNEWLQIAVAGLGALGVWRIPNAEKPPVISYEEPMRA